MPMQPNTSFQIKSIQLRKFDFEQIKGLKDIENIELEQGIDAKYEKKDNTYIIFLGHQIKLKQKENLIYTVNSMIMGHIEVKENFDPKYLNNVVAILYSYLRPMVAQVTVMAKLPPLDLPPMNFIDLKLEEIKGLEKLDDIKK